MYKYGEIFCLLLQEKYVFRWPIFMKLFSKWQICVKILHIEFSPYLSIIMRSKDTDIFTLLGKDFTWKFYVSNLAHIDR